MCGVCAVKCDDVLLVGVLSVVGAEAGRCGAVPFGGRRELEVRDGCLLSEQIGESPASFEKVGDGVS